MNIRHRRALGLWCSSSLFLAAALALVSPAHAQTATPDDGSVLPIPPAPFKGTIDKTFEGSKQDYPQPVKPPEGAPNVVLILLDDLGFGQPGTFGGPVPTPAMDALAQEGLRYTRFHTTAICSPTRAALLTGRNHHQVATGTITELSTGYPGYNSLWPRSTATIAEILKDNGYSTAAFGKWHNTPDWETTPIGPFDHWPTGLGFEYWYGFQGGETSQWEPQLFRGTVPAEPSKRPEQGYNLNVDLVDDAVGWINRQQSVAPDKPYFVYFAPGAVHAPLHVGKDWIDKFKGQFDQGWDKVREETLARQKKLGVVPENTDLTPRPTEIAAWDTLDADARKVYARHQEVFAGFLAQTDHEIGRLIDAIRALPDAENTMVILVAGDNGPSPEGSLTGTLNNMMTQNGVPDTVANQLPKLDEIGGPLHENHYPVGWAWAGSSPFQWMKRVPSHFGGTRNGMIVSWPARIKDKSGLRTQFHHVIDIAPTILEAAKLKEPTEVNGTKQVPMAGLSMEYSFDDAKAAGTRHTQYFETGGHRAIYNDGWVAASFHGVPWALTGSIGFDNDTWQLYNTDEDFSQAHDVATKNPEKLAELQKLFDEEAGKYNVYPLDDRFAERGVNPARPSFTKGRTKFEYAAGTVRIPEGNAPPIYQRSHKITATVDVPDGGASGVIIATGGSSGGYSLYLEDGVPVYEYKFFGQESYRVAGTEALPPGRHTIELVYEQKPFEKFKEVTGGPATLSVDGRQVATGDVAKVVPARFSATETLDIGMDLGAVVSTRYEEHAPFAFSGTIDKVTVEVE
ncbi:arylsulfatase [Mesorhizobium sp. LHD-90]|uniref:arylsulfatase n=1 Tax=Mesorhizobium sp. LHD-90 TaxID=3071414 RepID=UPI0027E02358|nr:arylsulfatase [Mesorhizobium sp. LHD-90]MDQ6438164.1 arylsulfatase [Mesorhizobium sp. LHD-90]